MPAHRGGRVEVVIVIIIGMARFERLVFVKDDSPAGELL